MFNILLMSSHITELTRALARRLWGWGTAFHEIGFHGDLHLIRLVEHIVGNVDAFVETGASSGSSLAHVARLRRDMRCISCEPDAITFNLAKHNTKAYSNVELHPEDSAALIKRIKLDPALSQANILFWLDAHGYGFEWPLRDEISNITSHWSKAWILIDDFKVPGMSCFGYDEYKGQICSYDYIRDSLFSSRNYRLFYPSYTDCTSNHEPLRGWGLIEYGHEENLYFDHSLVSLLKQGKL
jgi:hypothetical protein